MSGSAFDQSKEARKLCQSCHDRKARFAFRGRVKADRDHTLCFECYRAERERRRAAALAQVDTRPLPLAASPRRELTASDVEHRRRMLAHMEGSASAL
jgi:hypothetical protein